MSTDYVPSREDRFSFGIWTVGWQGVDVFGSAVRPPMPAERAVYKLAELGAYGVNFHDNDVFAFGAGAAERDERIGAFSKALAETGLVVTTATTNLFGHPIFRDGAFTANDRQIGRLKEFLTTQGPLLADGTCCRRMSPAIAGLLMGSLRASSGALTSPTSHAERSRFRMRRRRRRCGSGFQ